MVSQNNIVLCVAMLMTFFMMPNSPAAYAAKDDSLGAEATPLAPTPSEPYKFVKEFCHQRRSRDRRAFCIKVLASNPKSAWAKDYVDLLYISLDFAVGYANSTKEYMISLLKNSSTNATKEDLIAALKHCISDYDIGIDELLLVTRDMKDDPSLASYDALLASDQLGYCGNALKSSKVADESILSRHKIATAYVWLCVDVAMKID